MKSKFLCSLLLLSACAIAQTPPANTAAVPELDELSVTKIKLQVTQVQNMRLLDQELQHQKAQINEDAKNLAMEIEKKYPGFTLDFSTGKLVPKQAVVDTKLTTPKTK